MEKEIKDKDILEENSILVGGLIAIALGWLLIRTPQYEEYKLKKDEIKCLKEDLEEIIGVQVSDIFINDIAEAIYSARNEYYASQNSLNAKDFNSYLTKLENACNKLKYLLIPENDEVDGRYSLFVHVSPFFAKKEDDSQCDTKTLLDNLNSVLENCQYLRKEMSKSHFKNTLKTEIRHKLLVKSVDAFRKENIKIAKYENGILAQSTSLILDYFSYRNEKVYLVFSKPDQLFKIIDRAVEESNAKETERLKWYNSIAR